jgi:hypothetical protein
VVLNFCRTVYIYISNVSGVTFIRYAQRNKIRKPNSKCYWNLHCLGNSEQILRKLFESITDARQVPKLENIFRENFILVYNLCWIQLYIWNMFKSQCPGIIVSSICHRVAITLSHCQFNIPLCGHKFEPLLVWCIIHAEASILLQNYLS